MGKSMIENVSQQAGSWRWNSTNSRPWEGRWAVVAVISEKERERESESEKFCHTLYRVFEVSIISVYVAANRLVTTVKEIIPHVSQVCHLYMVSKFHVAAIMYKAVSRNSTPMSGSKCLPLQIKLQFAAPFLSLIKKTISYGCTLVIC